MYSFWQRNKTAVVLGLAGGAKSLLDNYWVFTSLPLAGPENWEKTDKFFYLLAQMTLASILWGTVGSGVDRLRRIAPEPEATPLASYNSLQMH